MMLIGYARTSTFDQVAGFDAQLRDLGATGCTKIFQEQVSSVAHREQLEAALDFVREGDTLVVTRLDRLCRSTADLLKIIDRLQAKGVALRILDFGGSEVDTQSPTGKLVLTVLSAMAQFELELLRLRMREGVERAKAAGKYKGRAPTARRKLTQIRELSLQGMKPVEIARQLSISRASVYRLLAEQTA
jgi:DNA invertase Pin-like site-specific DNA recombinase